MTTAVESVLISDLHLSDETPELMQRFLQLLEVLPGRCRKLKLMESWHGG